MTGWLRSVLVAAFLLLWPAASQAAVEIQFYSHDMGRSFPHAFVVLKGTLDTTGEPVDTNLGFSATSVSPAMLVKSFEGAVEVGIIPPAYIARSTKQFTLILSDDEYRAVMGVVEAWRSRKQPTYNLNTSNCVHFIGDIALALRLKGEPRQGLMKNPREFLERVRADSLSLLAERASALAAKLTATPAAIATSAAEPADVQARQSARQLETLAQ